jgi:PHP family Zn ribbon phosphoesterase
MNRYYDLTDSVGTEISILTDMSIDEISKFDEKVADMIAAYRDGTVGYIPGGGGRYGKLVSPWEEK